MLRFLATRFLGLAFALVAVTCTCLAAEPPAKIIRVGIIGLDTSHAPAFTKAMNSADATGDLAACKVVAAYPHGSATIESSASRIPKFTAELRGLGVKITESIDELLGQVDCVLLETNDGRLHLEQAEQVFASGKLVFIDKPLAANLSDVLAIEQAAQKHKASYFSSSSLRYSKTTQAARAGEYGRVTGCAAFSPCSLEPTHVDLFWYGIHGVETLFTVMGPGCESVTHMSTDDYELVTGKWSDGRIGTFRGLRSGKSTYGATIFTDRSIQLLGKYDGYTPLVQQIATYFVTGVEPIARAETIEIYAFMQAASASKSAGGAPVDLADVMQAK